MKKLTHFLSIGLLSMPFLASQPVDAFKLFGDKKTAENKDESTKKVDNNETLNKQSNEVNPTKTDTQNDTDNSVSGENDAQKSLSTAENAPSSISDTNTTPEVNASQNKNVAVVFNNGTKIEKSAVNEELSNIPLDLSSRMSYAELSRLVAFKLAYQKIIDTKVKEMKLADDPEISKSMQSRRKSYASSKFLNKQVEKIMTNAELEKYYNEMWDKHMKGTNEISGIMISARNKDQSEKILKVKSEDDLNKIVNEYKNGKSPVATQSFDMPEGALPPDIVKQIKVKGSNSIVGPFNIQGMAMFLFVKSVHPAVKKPFSGEIREQYKQVAHREFANRYVKKLMEDNNVVIYDLLGKPVDLNKKDDSNKKKDDKKDPVNLSTIKDDFVIAKIGNKITLKIADLYPIYNIKSIENELFASMSVQLKVSMEEVIQSAIKLCVQDRLLEQEMTKNKFMDTKEIKTKFEQIDAQQLRRAYFNKTVKITETDARKEFNKYLETIKPDAKDDQEISVRLMFYSTENEAKTSLKKYQGTPKSFSKDFEEAAKNKKAIDLGYIRKVQSISPISPIWESVKTAAPAACCKQVIKVNGEAFGFPNKNFAVAYIGDRRQIKLPTFEETQSFFRKVAEKMQAIAIVEKLMKQEIASIDNVPMNSIKPEELNKLLINIITEDTELPIEKSHEN